MQQEINIFSFFFFLVKLQAWDGRYIYNVRFLLLCLADLQRLVDGADEYLQLLDVTSNVMRALCNMPEEFQYDS